MNHKITLKEMLGFSEITYLGKDGDEVMVHFDDNRIVLDAYVSKDSPLLRLKSENDFSEYLQVHPVSIDDDLIGYNWQWTTGNNPRFVHLGSDIRDKNVFIWWITQLGYRKSIHND